MVLAVSDETPALVGPYVERFGLELPVAAGSTARYAYGVNAFPTAILLGPDGRVVWRGHYKSLTPRLIQSALEGVVLGSPLAYTSETAWPERTSAAARLAADGELRDALASLDALLAEEATEELAEERVAAERLQTELTAHVSALVEKARRGLAKDPIGSWRLVEALADELDGHPLEADARALLDELAEDDELAAEIAARRELDACMKVLQKRGLHRARGKLEALVQRYPGTQAAEDARALLRR